MSYIALIWKNHVSFLFRPALPVQVLLVTLWATSTALAQLSPVPANSISFNQLIIPPGAPAWLGQHWHQSLSSPQPSSGNSTPSVAGITFPQYTFLNDPTGQIAEYQVKGATIESANAFFLSLGTNGRTCATCHTPDSSMGLSLANIRSRYNSSLGKDPLFAAFDGATCPKNAPATNTYGAIIGGLLGQGSLTFSPVPSTGTVPLTSPYAALLNKGLIRIPLPVAKGAEFTVEVISDPYGCNLDPHYNQVTNSDGSISQVVSVYRRPLIAANLASKVKTLANSGVLPPENLLTGLPLGVDVQGNLENGNIMSDGREPTLSSQAIDATLGHAQALQAPTAAQVSQIVSFESNLYTAQESDNLAGDLSLANGYGGVWDTPYWQNFETAFPTSNVMTMFGPWASSVNQQQASIERGQNIFNNRAFAIKNVAGFNNFPGLTNPAQGTCSTCHAQINMGSDIFPDAQRDIGIGGDDWYIGGPTPATDLPVFLLTCAAGKTTPFNTAQVLTNDPGKALITGKCADIGTFTVPSLRGLAARAPYFTDGSAPGLTDVVNFYNKRFNIGFSAQDVQDLVNFLNAM